MPARLQVRRLVLGPFETNCYIASDPDTRQALIIDPGEPSGLLPETIRRESLLVVGIVNTHGHGDHIAGNEFIKAEFGCPIMIHELDAPALTDSHANLSAYVGLDCIESPPADRLLYDGGTIEVGATSLSIIHTPGHSPGGICLLSEDILFSGDTLFAGSVGRTDFPGCSHEQLIGSISERLMSLPDDTRVYPGHGPETTIGDERRHNPWITQ